MTDMNSDASSDEELEFSTQNRHEIFTLIKDRYGHLAKQDFCGELAGDHAEHDLSEYRQAIYDYSIKTIPDTPRANLVNRKDTSHKTGGLPLDIKLAEDIFNLFHYTRFQFNCRFH